MNLYILRHANAGVRRQNPLLDLKRPLDKEGKQQCIILANSLNALKIQFDLIVSSPLKRALQTASMVGNETGYEKSILLSEALKPAGTYEQFQRLVSEHSALDSVLVVGHNPNLVQFLGSLIAPAGQPAAIRLRKGAIARVDVSRRPAVLYWLLDPRIARNVYNAASQARTTRSSRRKTSRK